MKTKDIVQLSLQRTWRRLGMMVVLGLTMFVLSTVVAVAWSARDAWQRQADQQVSAAGMDRITVTAARGADPIRWTTVQNLSGWPGVRQAVPRLVGSVYVETSEGEFRPVQCAGYLPQDPTLALVPLIEGDCVEQRPGSTIVVAPNFLQRLGYPTRGVTGRRVRLRTFRDAPGRERQWCEFPSRVSAVVGDLGSEGLRLDLATLARVYLYKAQRIERVTAEAETVMDSDESQVAGAAPRPTFRGPAQPEMNGQELDTTQQSGAVATAWETHTDAATGDSPSSSHPEGPEKQSSPPEGSRNQLAATGGRLDLGQILDQLEEIHAVDLYVRDPQPAEIERLQKALEVGGRFRCKSAFYERGRQAGLLAATARMVTPVLLVLAGTAVWAILFLMGSAVASEQPLIALWRSAGARAADIFLLYLLQSLWISLGGSVFGVLLAAYLVSYAGHDLGTQLDLELFAAVPMGPTIALMTLLGITSGAAPALRAAVGRIDEGLRRSGYVG